MNAPFPIEPHVGVASHRSLEAQTIDMLASNDHQERAFLRAAWFAAGESPAIQWTIVRAENGHGIAAFPLQTKSVGPLTMKQVGGAYWPFRGIPMRADTSSTQLSQSLSSPKLQKQLGRVWRLGPVIDDDPQLQKLVAAAETAGWSVLSRPVGSIFALDLAALTESGNWPSTKGKQKDRWRVRQLEKTGPVRIETFTAHDWSDQTRDAIAEIERNSWVGQLEQGGDTKFLDPHLRAVWEGIAEDPVLASMIHGSLLYVGDTPAAFTFGLDCGTTRYCIANNFDQQFHKYSPGRVLLYDDFTKAAERGIDHLDWGLGDGGYKRQMGAEETSSVSDLLFVRGKLPAALLRRVWER